MESDREICMTCIERDVIEAVDVVEALDDLVDGGERVGP